MNERKRPDFVEHVASLLRERPRSLLAKTIAIDCGVDPSFVSRLMNGKLQDPGARAVIRIYEYLAGKPLEY